MSSPRSWRWLSPAHHAVAGLHGRIAEPGHMPERLAVADVALVRQQLLGERLLQRRVLLRFRLLLVGPHPRLPHAAQDEVVVLRQRLQLLPQTIR